MAKRKKKKRRGGARRKGARIKNALLIKKGKSRVTVYKIDKKGRKRRVATVKL